MEQILHFRVKSYKLSKLVLLNLFFHWRNVTTLKYVFLSWNKRSKTAASCHIENYRYIHLYGNIVKLATQILPNTLLRLRNWTTLKYYFQLKFEIVASCVFAITRTFSTFRLRSYRTHFVLYNSRVLNQFLVIILFWDCISCKNLEN